MTRLREFDPGGLSQLVGAGDDLLSHMGGSTLVRGLSQFRDDPALCIGYGCGELRAAQVSRETVGSFVHH
jgi:hypothetical protein